GEVYHSGSTAGYNAFLTRFPDQHLSVAVLCNATSGQATQYAHAVADLYLGERAASSPAEAASTAGDLAPNAGTYASAVTGVAITIGGQRDVLRAPTCTFPNRARTATDEYGEAKGHERVAP